MNNSDKHEELYQSLQSPIRKIIHVRYSNDAMCYAIITGLSFVGAIDELVEGITFEASYSGTIRLDKQHIDIDIRDYIDSLIAEHFAGI